MEALTGSATAEAERPRPADGRRRGVQRQLSLVDSDGLRAVPDHEMRRRERLVFGPGQGGNIGNRAPAPAVSGVASR